MMSGPGFKRWLKKKLQSEGVPSKVRSHRRNVVVAAGGRTVATTCNSDDIYVSWLRDHPSALGSLKEMMNMARGKHIVVFLDYDGTLSPIVSDPDRAFMSNKMRSAVSEVSMHFPTAIISGRSRNKVYEFVNLKWVYYAGSHGMDIKGPSQQVTSYDCKHQTKALDEHGEEFIIFQPAREYLPDIEEMIDELAEETREIEGVVIEDNRFCISVHYRHVKDEEYEDLKRRVKLVVEKNGCFRLTEGKKVMEIRPSIEWGKGHALEYLLEALGFSNTNDVLPIYIGDDRTDEDAFKVLRSRGVGFPIIVSSKPRETTALYSLRDPSEVLSFLVRMANWTLANYSQH